MENTLNPNLFQTPYDEFKDHLSIIDNHRILFSGRFGIGKTTFIKWFFEQPEIKEQYEVIHIYPVNYSVASNEDIFKYIKLDIIRQLLEKEEVTIDHVDISSLEYAPYFIKDNLKKIFADIITATASAYGELKGDKGLTKNIFSKLNELHGKFERDLKKTKEDISEVKTIMEFIGPIVGQEGNIYEFNLISQLIVQLLKSWKENIGNKQILLIIDDMDRVDPSHIFRIFNVFAAHFDHSTSTELYNKFGFDKIISVADVNNVKSVFNARFGRDTDFSGYLDKFFSHSVFAFNNISDIDRVVNDLLKKFTYKYKDNNIEKNLSEVMKYDFIGNDLTFLISAFLLSGKINFRRLTCKEIIVPMNLGKREFYFLHKKCFIVAKIQCLIDIVGSTDRLIECLESAETIIGKSRIIPRYSFIFNEGLPLLNFSEHLFESDNEREFRTIINNIDFNYKLDQGVANITRANGDKGMPITIPMLDLHLPSIFKLYKECILKLQQIGYLDY